MDKRFVKSSQGAALLMFHVIKYILKRELQTNTLNKHPNIIMPTSLAGTVTI